MKDSFHRITGPGHKPIPLAKAREIAEGLRKLAKEANIAIVIPRQVHPPARVEFPVGVDMVFGLYSPKADDSDAQIELHVLKSRKPEREPYTTIQTESSFCPECNEPVTLLSNGDRPQFYLCFDCKFVGEVGVGRVQEFKEPSEDPPGGKIKCPDCEGTGHYPGSVTPYCATCDGIGWIDG